jgi:hypothetical protein
MALDDYLQSILQEALAAPRRSSSRLGRQSPTTFSLGTRSLISCFTCGFSQALALCKRKESFVSRPGKNQEGSTAGAKEASAPPLLLLTPLWLCSLLSAFL